MTIAQPLGPVSVVMVEDNDADAELITRTLSRSGVTRQLIRVTTLPEFDALLTARPRPDVVLSDHNLQGFRGRDVLRRLRAVAPEVPFVLVTGSLDEETAVGYMKSGADDYVLKDRLAGLAAAVEAVCRQALERQALRRQDALLRTVLDAAPSLIFVKDWNGRFVLANQAVARAYRTTVEELIGRSDADFNPNADEVARFLADDRAVMTGSEARWIPEESLTDPDTGEQRWLETVKVPFRLPGEEGPLVLGIAYDITIRRSLDAQLRQAQKIEAIGQLAAGVAHDFNNLLTVILGTGDLVRESLAVDDVRRDHMDEILRTGERAAELVRQLLAFSRKQRLDPRVVDLNESVSAQCRMLTRLLPENIELVPVLGAQLGSVRVDPSQVEQILINLAVNARDAMPGGGRLTIETANVEFDETYANGHSPAVPGPHVMLAVSDTGHGMDAATRERIFEPFYTTKEPGKGTGLGLSTVYGIVKQSGGFIWVYSEVGRGTTFKVYFPRVDAEAELLTPVAAPARLQGRETVLVVEDAEAIRRLVRLTLENLGYTVIEAANGAEALEVARTHGGDLHLVLSDVVMPGLAGPELAARLTVLRPGIRVLFMSGYTDDAVVRHGVLSAAARFLQKPFRPDELAVKVRGLLDER